jgi:hypothetical protein
LANQMPDDSVSKKTVVFASPLLPSSAGPT